MGNETHDLREMEKSVTASRKVGAKQVQVAAKKDSLLYARNTLSLSFFFFHTNFPFYLY